MMRRIPWREDAACRDLPPDVAEAFFTGAQHMRLIQGAIFCREQCPVLALCRAAADRYETGQPLSHLTGVWGGELPSQRLSRRQAEREAQGVVVPA